MQLVRAGDVHHEDPVHEWLSGVLPDAGAVTVRQLLLHTSGLVDYDNLAAAAWRGSSPDTHQSTPRALVAVAAHGPSLFAPGKGQHYSNGRSR